jgi:hypothetical protein
MNGYIQDRGSGEAAADKNFQKVLFYLSNNIQTIFYL